MDPILELAAANGLKVIEDCAQAQGAIHKGLPVGGLGHVAAFSFCQDKIMTTGGEGGMMTTNDSAVWERAWSYRDHGRQFECGELANSGAGYRFVYGSCRNELAHDRNSIGFGSCPVTPRKLSRFPTEGHRSTTKSRIFNYLGVAIDDTSVADRPRLLSLLHFCLSGTSD